MAPAMLPFVSGGCFADPCVAINRPMQLLTVDPVAGTDRFWSAAVGYETRHLAVDSARYGCHAR